MTTLTLSLGILVVILIVAFLVFVIWHEKQINEADEKYRRMTIRVAAQAQAQEQIISRQSKHIHALYLDIEARDRDLYDKVPLYAKAPDGLPTAIEYWPHGRIERGIKKVEISRAFSMKDLYLMGGRKHWTREEIEWYLRREGTYMVRDLARYLMSPEGQHFMVWHFTTLPDFDRYNLNLTMEIPVLDPQGESFDRLIRTIVYPEEVGL